MSLFLGKIHYWLYKKIIWYEKIEMDIINWAQQKELPVGTWVQDINEKYGPPLGEETLEQLIDTSNIHGWLQQRIESAELRQAAIITQVLNRNIDYKKDLTGIYKNQGKAAAGDYQGETSAPEDVFNALNDYILEGMPCDRVNEIVSSGDKEFVWKSTICLHEQYWKRVEGDVNNFYELREAWIKAFVEELNSDFTYVWSDDNTHRISRKQKGR